METNSNDQKNFRIYLEETFTAQKTYQHIVKQSTAQERIKKLQRLKTAILQHKDEIVGALHSDFQKPPFETITTEIMILLSEIAYACENLEQWMTPVEQPSALIPNASVKIQYEPRGVVLIIGPWNFPFLLLISPLIPAIAAGNTAILKPSELTPAVCAVAKKVIAACFEEKEVAVIEGGVTETTELLQRPFDHIFFTGSPKVGKIVMEAAAKNLTSVTLELGGKSPAIVDTTADLDKAVARVLRGKTLNAGQICMSPDYLLIAEELKEAFITKTQALIQELFYQDGVFQNQDYSQIINLRNFERLQHLFNDALQKGAEVVLGGTFDAKARRIHPTLLSDVSMESAIMQEEIFGPLLPVFTYRTKEEAVAFIRRLDKPLAFYIFSEDQSVIDYYISHSTSGGVCVNDVLLQGFDEHIPFGGVNNSGIGHYHGVYGFQELSHAKGVFIQSPELPVNFFSMQPYAGKQVELPQ